MSDFDYTLTDAMDAAHPRPDYRYLRPPEPEYGRFGRGLRWGLLLAAFAWVLILLAGFLIARAGGP